MTLVAPKVIVFLLIGEFSSLISAHMDLFNTSAIDFFYGRNLDEFLHYHISQASDILYHPKFDHNRRTLLYIYGFQEYREYMTVQKMIWAYQQRDDHNILILDWSKIANGNYVFDAFPNTLNFGAFLADVIIRMTADGLDLANVHVVSHSLGGQLAGVLGRNIISKTNGVLRLKRITGLDPAFPLFYPGLIGGHLSAHDAEMVDVIHTDGWIYGAPISTGTVDFWPNGGKYLSQPGCPQRSFKLLSDDDLCAHWRSVHYYVESVLRKGEKIFPSRKCSSWFHFKAGVCDNRNRVVSMGIDCPMSARGDYYLQTNTAAPYSRGMKGVRYASDNFVHKSFLKLLRF